MKILKISVKFAILAAFHLMQNLCINYMLFNFDTLAIYKNIGIIIVFLALPRLLPSF